MGQGFKMLQNVLAFLFNLKKDQFSRTHSFSVEAFVLDSGATRCGENHHGLAVGSWLDGRPAWPRALLRRLQHCSLSTWSKKSRSFLPVLRNSPRNSEIFCIFLFEVDNLTAGCVKAGLKVVRIGRPEATRFDLEKYNLLEMVKDGFLHF